MIKNIDLNTIPDVIFESDSNGIIIDINDSVYNIFGYTASEVIGQPFDILMPKRFRKNHSGLFEGFQKKPTSRRMGNISEIRFLGLNKAGYEFHIDISLSLKNNNDGSKSFVAVIRDISELVSMNVKMTATILKLESKNKELEQLAYIISHDLKAPTRVVSQIISVIEEDHIASIESKVAYYFAEIKKRNIRMSDLIDGILSYSRAGLLSLEVERINMKELLQEVIESIHVPTGFEINMKSTNVEFYGSRIPFLQILSNLVGNAIKHHNKEHGTIEIKAILTPDEVEVKIKDDGPGIPAKYHSTIFEMFGTANEVSRTESTGIGLAIVTKIVEENGGTIDLSSDVGKGSEFTFTFKINNDTNRT
ncbi:ATP-binding protein [bacterium]|nr:ATP-binding protein [bacterium]